MKAQIFIKLQTSAQTLIIAYIQTIHEDPCTAAGG